ncbi:CDF family Co(II)/Ni(II) efflux transporter DmeF [Undibacterium sp.]|uniref:CDF family Co(II)/Ni(II) efflux transporter DmeF n=1 Tax=Undibacterium sp. TaxID=1914977 RepID=UPI00374D5848
MPTQLKDLSSWTHEHVFGASSLAAEKGARAVMWITLVMMVVEIAAGYWFNSMALLADGWHMSSHALAIGLSAVAYTAARKYARDASFAFGTWKIEILAGYTSAIFLLGIAALMVFSSAERIWSPQPIHYQEAIVIAVVGLIVNIVCAVILGGAHEHHGHDHRGHDHGHEHGHHGHGHDQHDDHTHGNHHDLNLKSAYIHVLADAATSVLAIAALAGGWMYGLTWLDPVMGIVGAVVVALWAKSLIIQTGKVLLDREMDHPVVDEIREAAEAESGAYTTRVTDLHVWRVGKGCYSCAASVVTNNPALTSRELRERITVHEEVVHTTIEIHHC